MFKKYTSRGRSWEIANSWWILFTFVPIGIAGFISFLYTGIRVKNWRWTIFGLIYLAATIAVFVVHSDGIVALIAITLWAATIFHAFKIRPAYLVHLDVMKSGEKVRERETLSQLRQEAEEKFQVTGTGGYPPPPRRASAPEPEPTPGGDPPERVDINTASEAEIAAIPEIGIILAKKVVQLRQELGGFQSFEQFSQRMEFKEHRVAQIERKVTFSPAESDASTAQPMKSGRVIDY